MSNANNPRLFRNLKPFDIDRERGFLPKRDPLRSLPTTFRKWDDLGEKLPKFLVAGQTRSAVHQLPMLDITELKRPEQIERAMVLLSFIGHAYVWEGQEPAHSIPPQLAVPWHALAVKLGRPPVLSYASYALHNWQRIDSNGPLALGNIALLQNFLAGIDEEWFILVHIDIESKAASMLWATGRAILATERRQISKLENELASILASLQAMHASLSRMTENCDPYIYYNRVRPYIHGWKNHPILKEGLLYEGVAAYGGRPQQFRGETGAQSSLIPALDALLQVGHKDDPLRPYLLEMQDYMPPGHRAFVKALEATPCLRDLVIEKKKSQLELKRLYNECVTWVEKFRTLHLEYAASYINNQSQTNSSNPTGVGTGGTPFIAYLKKHRDETGHHLID